MVVFLLFLMEVCIWYFSQKCDRNGGSSLWIWRK
ncbi:hypothetical protein GLYMA_20G064551v4 [Glycine max]|nr:hypothetical protein GLYMA_20G064551v4 [Glycine max]KAH1034853.1 hypothetical protein GYH30_055011 [Glycine max]